MKLKKDDIKQRLLEFIIKKGYEITTATGIISPFFVDEFNLSAGHQFVLPALNNQEKVDIRKAGTIEWCIRRDDIDRIGYTNTHLACFEMAVFGHFGYIQERKLKQILLFQQLNEFFSSIGLQNKMTFYTVTNGAKILNIKFNKDSTSYDALIEANIKTSNIIFTNGRQNFVFSNGENRASGYNIEIYYNYNGNFIEIASANIYEYILKGNELTKSINTGVGFGIGLERLEMIVNNLQSVYENDYFNERLGILHQQIPDKLNRQIVKQKLIKIIELNKTIEHINERIDNSISNINKKQRKAYNFIKAKLNSELDYLQIDLKKINSN